MQHIDSKAKLRYKSGLRYEVYPVKFPTGNPI